MTKEEYSNSVYNLIYRMKIDEEIIISDLMNFSDHSPEKTALPNEKAIPYFIAIVKDFIHYENEKHNGYYLEFNNDFTKLKKFAYWKTEKSPEPELNYDTEINSLKEFFATAKLPKELKLNAHTTLLNTRKAVDSHLNFVSGKRNNYKLPYLERLREIKNAL